MITPWGLADNKKVYAEGIVFYSTPSHGGFKVNSKQRAAMSIQYRNVDGWYEEDLEYVKVVLAFPHLFTPALVDIAAKTYTTCYSHDGTYKQGSANELTGD